MNINAESLHFRELNEQISLASDSIIIENCLGQRFLASGTENKKVTIYGTPGNALGSYLNGSRLEIHGNVQEATGDTMNEGSIIVHGNAGDATGYAMRGGIICVSGSTGYRAGIHMKAYGAKVPALVIGKTAGNFLGEYQAGGIIIVLGLGSEDRCPVGNFCATGMHGGKILIRTDYPPEDLPKQISARKLSLEELEEFSPFIHHFCKIFGGDPDQLMADHYWLLSPDTHNPYHRLYTIH